MRWMTALALLLAAADAAAAVYKWTKPDGSVIYSDRPPSESASPTPLPPVQEITIAPPASSAPSDSESDPSQDKPDQPPYVPYTKLEINTPEDGAAVRGNGGTVDVSLTLVPALQQGDKVTILLDGKEIGEGSGTSLTLSNVDRGTHTLQAVVKNSRGKRLIHSSTITFTLQRTSIHQPAR